MTTTSKVLLDVNVVKVVSKVSFRPLKRKATRGPTMLLICVGKEVCESQSTNIIFLSHTFCFIFDYQHLKYVIILFNNLETIPTSQVQFLKIK